jgi:hypothetical protein
MSLSNSTAKRMYRFLDKRFHHKPDWTFDLKELAHEHIGSGRHYEGPAHLKRNLSAAIAALENAGFLEPLPESERFIRDGKNWKIRLVSQAKSAPLVPLPDIERMVEPEPPRLVTQLTDRGVSRAAATELVQRHPAEAIEAKIEMFDWLAEKQDKRIAKSPAGYLVKSIKDDYAAPKGFVSKAERQQRQEEQQAKDRQATEKRRQERAQEERDQAEQKAIAAYWDSLSPEQQAQLQSEADAQADPETLALEKGPLKRLARQIRREEYIRQMLHGHELVPADV